MVLDADADADADALATRVILSDTTVNSIENLEKLCSFGGGCTACPY